MAYDSKNYDAMHRKMAVGNAAEWMDNVIACMERRVAELKRCKENFLVSATNPKAFSSAVSQLGYFVNEIQNVHHNLRLDLVANHASALALTEPKV